MKLQSNTNRIKLVGIGVEGSVAIDNLSKAGIKEIDFITMDTKSLHHSNTVEKPDFAPTSLILNYKSEDTIKEALQDSELIFVVTDGKSGTENISTISATSRELGVLTVGIIIEEFESDCSQTVQEHREALDALIVLPKKVDVPNVKEQNTTEKNINPHEKLSAGIVAITKLLTQKSILEVTITDIKFILQNTGDTVLGIAKSSGERSVQNAALEVISPHNRDILKNVERILIIITGSSQLSLFEINDAIQIISDQMPDNANVIFGYVVDESFKDSVEITFFATEVS